MRRVGVRAKEGESLCVMDGESIGVSDGESNRIDGYLGRISFRKWAMYCSTHGRYVGSASSPFSYSAGQ